MTIFKNVHLLLYPKIQVTNLYPVLQLVFWLEFLCQLKLVSMQIEIFYVDLLYGASWHAQLL